MLTHDCVDTVCYEGHMYCQECHPNCPTCNKAYVPRDFRGLKELEHGNIKIKDIYPIRRN